jgi:VWFA-related protein
VPQRVDDISYGRLPIDVTIALDVSYSVTGALLDRLRRGVVDLMRDLGAQDRLKLVLFNMHVTRTTDFTTDPAVVERAIRGATAGGGTALLDALSVSLVSASAPDRRQLIVAFTDGSDSSSATSAAVLIDVARRTRATLAFVLPAAAARPVTVISPGSLPSSRVQSSARITRPGPFQKLFSTLVTETGGSILPADTGNLSETFRRVLGEFRSAYVLYYTAQGVDPRGYHTIRVQVNRDGAQVQARRGYFGV